MPTSRSRALRGLSVRAPRLTDVTEPAAAPAAPLRCGAGRWALVSDLLADAVASLAHETSGGPVRVLDCGGGTGAFAVPLARAGAEVTVLDISADALATLRRRADEAGVSGSVHAVAGDVESLEDFVPPGEVDLVLAHGILGAVDDPGRTVVAMAAAVRPGGLVSLLVANPVASVLARALGGEPSAALAELRALDSATDGLDPERVADACRTAGLVLEARHGIGVFSDLVPGAALDAPGARAAVAALDTEAAGRPPFAEIAGRVHLLARRPRS